MSNYYYDHLGTTFTTAAGSYHSFRDFGLYPREHPEIQPAAIKSKVVDIPGANGSIDMTELPQGWPTFKNRTGTFAFLCPRRERWDAALTAISAALHGRMADIVKDEEPTYRYRGRVSVDALECDEMKGFITIKAELEPFKYERTSTSEDWLWDPFNFETGIIRDYAEITVDGETAVTVWSSPVGGMPVITASAAMMLTYDGETYSLTAGTNNMEDIELPHSLEEVTFTFSGNGTVSIDFLPGFL